MFPLSPDSPVTLPAAALAGLLLAPLQQTPAAPPQQNQDTTRAAARPAARDTARAQDQGGELLVLNLDGTPIALTATRREFRHVFRLETDTARAATVTLAVPPLVGPLGQEHPVRLSAGGRAASDTLTLTVPALGSVAVALEADLPHRGVYRGSFSQLRGGRRDTRVLQVSRGVAEPSVQVLGSLAARQTLRLTEPVGFWVTVRDTSGLPARLLLPAVEELRGASDTLQAEFTRVRVEDHDGQRLTGSFGLDGQGEAKRLRVELEGLRQPGHYTGVVSVAAPGGRPVQRPFVLFVRRSVWWAIALILLGVVVAERLRHWLGTGRPRAVQRGKAAGLLERADRMERELRATGGITEAEAGVLDGFRVRLDALFAHVELGSADKADEVIEEVRAKLGLVPDWVTGRRRVEALQPEELRPPFRDSLREVERYLRREGADDEAAKKARETLDGLEGEIRKALKAAVKKDLDDFRKSLDETKKLRKDDAPLLGALAAEVEAPLDEAAEELEKEAPDFERVRARFDQARLAYARRLAAALAARVEAQEKPTYFGDAAAWEKLRGEVRGALAEVADTSDPEAAIERFGGAQGAWVRGLATALRAYLPTQVGRVPAAIPDRDKQKEQLDKLDAARDQLDAALESVALGRSGEAAASLAAAERDHEAVDDAIEAARTGDTMGGRAAVAHRAARTTSASVPAAEVPTGAVAGTAAVTPAPKHLESQADIARRIRDNDRIALAVGAVLAVVLGVSLLYAGKPAWGSGQDLLAAVLWGLGLQGATFNGVAGLLDRVKGGQAAEGG